jgi:hypothetical protein
MSSENCKSKPDFEEVFGALDAADISSDFLSAMDRDRHPPQERPELEKLFEEELASEEDRDA